MAAFDVPDRFSQLATLCAAIAIEDDPGRKSRMLDLERKLLRLVLPEIQGEMDQTDEP